MGRFRGQEPKSLPQEATYRRRSRSPTPATLTAERETRPGRGGGVGWGAGQRADADQAALAFDGGEDARRARAVHGIHLPVAEAAPACDDGRTILDRPLAREATAAVLAAVAFAAPLAGAAQVEPERASLGLVTPEPQVD